MSSCYIYAVYCLSVCSYISKTICPNNSKSSVGIVVARFSCDDSAIRYVLPVLWMTSCFRINVSVGQNQRRRYVWSSSPGGGTRGISAVYDCLVFHCFVDFDKSFGSVYSRKLFTRMLDGGVETCYIRLLFFGNRNK